MALDTPGIDASTRRALDAMRKDVGANDPNPEPPGGEIQWGDDHPLDFDGGEGQELEEPSDQDDEDGIGIAMSNIADA